MSLFSICIHSKIESHADLKFHVSFLIFLSLFSAEGTTSNVIPLRKTILTADFPQSVDLKYTLTQTRDVRAVFWHSHELCIVSDASAEMWQDMNVASINQRYFDKLSTQRLNKWVADAVLEKRPDLCTPMTIADFYRRCQSSNDKLCIF